MRTEERKPGSPMSDPLQELPEEIRRRIARCVRTPQEIANVAQALQAALDDIAGNGTEIELRAIATRLRGHAELGNRLLLELVAFAGELQGLAWCAGVRELAATDDHAAVAARP